MSKFPMKKPKLGRGLTEIKSEVKNFFSKFSMRSFNFGGGEGGMGIFG